MSKIRLAIVGKQETMREGIKRILAGRHVFEIVSCFRTAEETVEQCQNRQPDVIFICCSLPDYGGIKAIEYLHDKLPKPHIILSSDVGPNGELMSAVAAGVRAYLSQQISISHLICAITLVAEGNLIVSPHMAEKVVTIIKSLCQHEGKAHLGELTVLTKREKAVLDLVKQGLTNKKIATALNISEHTVKVHMQNIMEKTHAHTRQEAVSVFGQENVLHRIRIT